MKYKKIRAKQKLREILKERDITQEGMAIDLQLSTTGVNKIVNGTGGSKFTGNLIANYLKVDYDEIFEIKED